MPRNIYERLKWLLIGILLLALFAAGPMVAEMIR